MVKKPTHKKLLKLWGQVIMLRDKYTCKRCHRTPAKNPHHIFTKGRRSTAYLLENGVNLCFDCHMGSPYYSAHKAPDAFKEWLLDKWITEKQYDALKLSSNLVDKPDRRAA